MTKDKVFTDDGNLLTIELYPDSIQHLLDDGALTVRFDSLFEDVFAIEFVLTGFAEEGNDEQEEINDQR